MKLVYFIDHLRPDGAQKFLHQLVEGMASRGHQQIIICLNDSWDTGLVEQIRRAGVRVHIVGKIPLASGIGWLMTLRLLRRDQYDVAITCLFAADVIGRLLARAANIPRIITAVQTRNANYPWWKFWLVRLTAPLADLVVSCSATIRTFVAQHEGVPLSRIEVIPNSVSVGESRGSYSSEQVREELGLGPNDVLIGSVGRLTEQKGFDVLLHALPMVHGSRLRVVIAGVGELDAMLRRLAAELGIADRVYFAGYRRDVSSLLSALDLYVHPSRFEGMPFAVLEAMAAGCPIVASAVDGTRELIDDGVHGWLVPPDDPVALAYAIDAALGDIAEARRRGELARQRVAAQFNVDAMVDAWEQILIDITREAPTGVIRSERT
ncbi:MAG: glycosyltransferase [Kouleothrix sp.]|nr:glycosyltransferase [Kouleothrix sp.]